MKFSIRTVLAGAVALALLTEFPTGAFMATGFLPTEAHARVGRPATPGSVAGVARRTTRRTIRRGTYYATLPGGCRKTTVYGYSVWDCSGTYYQSSGSGYVVVYF